MVVKSLRDIKKNGGAKSNSIGKYGTFVSDVFLDGTRYFWNKPQCVKYIF